MTTSNVSLPCIQNDCVPPQVYTEQRLSIVSIVCRICYDNEKEEPLITPCRCKGTVAFVHKSCLETWLAESNTSTCELCHQIFKTERTPRYSSLKSIWRWLRVAPVNQRGARGVKSDLLACGLLTPIAIIITYICLFSSDYYNQKKFATIPAARWTSLSLLFMIAIMLIGYYLWVYSVIRLHARMWYNWWQRECVVKYVPPSTINICPTCPSRVNTPHNTPLTRTSSVENITDPCLEPRIHSVFELEREEAEIHNENLDHITDNKQKSVMSEENISLDMEEEVQYRDMKANKENGPLTLIQNKGVVHILNFGEPTDISMSLHERLNLLNFSSASSVSSRSSNVCQIHNDNTSDIHLKSLEKNERLTLSNSASSGDNTDPIRKNNNLHKSEDCIRTRNNSKEFSSITKKSITSFNITPYIKQVVPSSQDILPFNMKTVPSNTNNKKVDKTKPNRNVNRFTNTSSEEESSTESEDKIF